MNPGRPAVCRGVVLHRRNHPVGHEFRHRVSYVWLDPDRPDELVKHHRLWSEQRFRPVRFRRSDYGVQSSGSLGDEVRSAVESVVPAGQSGPIRMLTQLRRWGWLFNPITVYLVWSAPDDLTGDPSTTAPRAALLEVTNTPWKERHRYVAPLDADGPDRLTADFDKHLHVSPFLELPMHYRLTMARRSDIVDLRIDVSDPTGRRLLETKLLLDRRAATGKVLAGSIRRDGLSTIKVSLAIHFQAARLWAKRVPFVPHPTKRRRDALATDQ